MSILSIRTLDTYNRYIAVLYKILYGMEILHGI